LYLEVSTDGKTKRWLYRFTSPVTHRATEAGGIGIFPEVGLADARAKADEYRTLVKKGIDPIVQKREACAAKKAAEKASTTFGDALDVYVDAFKDKGASTIELDALVRRHAATSLLPRPLDKITSNDVLTALAPVQQSIPKTAARLRAAVATIFDYSIARGFVSANPASASVFKFLIPAPPKPVPHRMMPFAEIPAFVARLQENPSAAKLCLALLILTATRSQEAIRATWAEIDLEGRTWTIPAARMKARRDHKVPLSDAAIAVLTQARDLSCDAMGFVFPGMTKGSPPSPRTLEAMLHRQLREPYAVHGFRASFSTWCNETQPFAHEDNEACLAYLTGNAVSRAYDRAEKVAKRAVILEGWGDFVAGRQTSNVLPFTHAAKIP
jgi:integrase